MDCGFGLVFNQAGLFCTQPENMGCEQSVAFAAARETDASPASPTQGSSTLVAVLSAAVAVLAGCVVALVVVHMRGRRAPAGDVPLSGVAVGDGVSMRRGVAHQKLSDDAEQNTPKSKPVDV